MKDGYRSKKTRLILYCGVLFFFLTGVTSCFFNTKEKVRQDEMTRSLIGFFGEFSEMKMYIEPSPVYDILLATRPTVAEEQSNAERIIEEIKENIDPKEMAFQYLERRRQYAKTSIFADTP